MLLRFRALFVTFVAIAILGGSLGFTPVAQADTGCPIAASSYGGGSGTSGDPYLISTPAELQRLRDRTADYSNTFLFSTDIDMGGCVWSTPIADGNATFTGTLDGDGHVITGLSVAVVNPVISYVGLVGYLGANGAIRDLGFTGDVSLTESSSNGSSYVAGLVGFTFSPTTISGSYATGNVTVNHTLTSCGITCDLFVTAGGLVGMSQSTVTNSFARGNVQVTVANSNSGGSAGADVGGAIGDLGNGSVTSVYATGTANAVATAPTSTLRRGGFAGLRSVSATLNGLLWDTTTSSLSSATGMGSSTGITGATTALMTATSTYSAQGWSIDAGYDPSRTWGICSGTNSGYPFLTTFFSSTPCLSSGSSADVPPSWHQSVMRDSSISTCEAGWSGSWAQWPHGGKGGFVCNREMFYDTRTQTWSVR